MARGSADIVDHLAVGLVPWVAPNWVICVARAYRSTLGPPWCSANMPVSSPSPAASSLIHRPSFLPPGSISVTSWWSLAQSIPHKWLPSAYLPDPHERV